MFNINKEGKTIVLDMDGVLFNFSGRLREKMLTLENFMHCDEVFQSGDLMDLAIPSILSNLKTLGYKLVVLSIAPRENYESHVIGKINWLKSVGLYSMMDEVRICPQGTDKGQVMQEFAGNEFILVDDFSGNIISALNAGHRAIQVYESKEKSWDTCPEFYSLYKALIVA